LREFKDIKAFFIFRKESGDTLFTRSYETTNTKAPDPHLVVAFLTAMFSFAESSALSDLRVVDMEDVRFSFIEKNGLVFAILASPLVSAMDLQFKLKTISSLFLSEHPNHQSIQLIDTEMFEGFGSQVDAVFTGETRELLSSSKEAALFYLRKLVNSEDVGIRGAMIVSFTGEPVIEFQMDKDRMSTFITVLTVSSHMRNLRYLIASSEATHLVAYKISEGLILCIDGYPETRLESLVVRVSETVAQIKEIIPH
jgi:predicted regulator of Ras-like GTPase activity (Roadblock/LC7/MglB family)